MVVTGNQSSIPEREPEKRLPHPRKAAGLQIIRFQMERSIAAHPTQNNGYLLIRNINVITDDLYSMKDFK